MNRVVLVSLLVACNSSSQPRGGVDAGDSQEDATDTGPVSATCEGRMTQPLNATWTIEANGGSRTARVHVPASYDPSVRTAVVLNFHGRTGSGSQQAAMTHMLAKSDAEGFIVVHPEAMTSPTSWNGGPGCCDPAYADDVNDVGFVRKLLDEVDAKLCVDPDRVFATGFSNGGYLAHRLGCELSDRIAAISSVAGLIGVTSCGATRPVPVLDVHGTEDPLVYHSLVGQTIQYWSTHNGCTGMQTSYQNGAAKCVTHSGCDRAANVVQCTITGGGHQWPGGEALPSLGVKSDDLIATDAIWTFFAEHPFAR
ncbi:MAG: PHB depolymerase family esterase [Kofleriaceae bacterium]